MYQEENEMKKSRMMSMCAVLGMAVFAGTMTGYAADVTLSIAHCMSEDSIDNDVCTDVKNYIEEKSEGAIQVDIFPANTMGGETDYVEGIIAGTIDMGLFTPSVLQAWCSEAGLFDLPFMINDFETAYGVWESDICDPLKEQMKSIGMEPYGACALGARMLTNNVRPVVTPEDVKGLTLRTMIAQVPVETWELLGANVVSMNIGEVFSALQTGVVDGQENPINAIRANNFQEVQKYISLTGHTFSMHLLPLSSATASRLTEEQLEIVKEGILFASEESGKHLEERTDRDLQALIDAGMEVNDVDLEAFQAACQPIYDKYADVYGDKIQRVIDKDF